MQKKSKNLRINVNGNLPKGVTAKDVILKIIGTIGTAGGTGYVVEFAGDVIKSLSMEERMTVCNMTIEAGARAGLIAPDEKTFSYLKGKTMSPKGENWTKAVEFWKTLYNHLLLGVLHLKMYHQLLVLCQIQKKKRTRIEKWP